MLICLLKSRLSKFTVTADGEFVQVPLAQITWYHHISMFHKVKDNILRAFYITESALQGWSRDIMLMQIDDGYHKKVKSFPNNFADTLPPLKSDLAKAAFKDPYNFGFVNMTKVKQETDLEDLFHKRNVITHYKKLLKGDFLIDDRSKIGAKESEFLNLLKNRSR